MSAAAVEVSEDDKRRHREAEKSLKEVGLIHPGHFSVYICVSSEQIPLHQLGNSSFSGEATVIVTSQGMQVIYIFDTLTEPSLLGFTIRIRGFREIYYPQGL